MSRNAFSKVTDNVCVHSIVHIIDEFSRMCLRSRYQMRRIRPADTQTHTGKE